jgi:hypothetical protein
LRVLKTLELIGFFNEFKDGALLDFKLKKLQSTDKEAYIKSYIAWATLLKDKKGDKTKITQERDRMKAIESQVEAPQIITLRKSAIEKLRANDNREKEMEEIEA